MKITGDHVVPAPAAEVWDALLDPTVLVRTIPGCARLEETAPSGSGTHEYAMTVTAGVAAVRGTYDGRCALTDLDEPRSLTMRLSGAGAPGTVDATVAVRFEDLGDQGTRIAYDADATVGGMVGGVGQRMLQSVSRRMAAEFFGNVEGALSGAPQPTPADPADPANPANPANPATTETGGAARVFTAPPKPQPSRGDFLAGVAVGAGLVLLGVLAGSRLGRRR